MLREPLPCPEGPHAHPDHQAFTHIPSSLCIAIKNALHPCSFSSCLTTSSAKPPPATPTLTLQPPFANTASHLHNVLPRPHGLVLPPLPPGCLSFSKPCCLTSLVGSFPDTLRGFPSHLDEVSTPTAFTYHFLSTSSTDCRFTPQSMSNTECTPAPGPLHWLLPLLPCFPQICTFWPPYFLWVSVQMSHPDCFSEARPHSVTIRLSTMLCFSF